MTKTAGTLYTKCSSDTAVCFEVNKPMRSVIPGTHHFSHPAMNDRPLSSNLTYQLECGNLVEHLIVLYTKISVSNSFTFLIWLGYLDDWNFRTKVPLVFG